jgi:hypothetical protein
VRCSSRTPTPATTATFYKATATTAATTNIIANKGESRIGACGAQRDIYGESVIINLWTPLFFFETCPCGRQLNVRTYPFYDASFF